MTDIKSQLPTTTGGFKFPKKRVIMMLYGKAGVGKTITIMTLLKRGLKVRVLCAEANAITGIEEALAIHKIELAEGQLIVAFPGNESASSTDAFANQETDAFYLAIVGKIVNFKGFDVATGKEVTLGKVMAWDTTCAFVLDGMTMTENACAARGRKMFKEAPGENKNDQRMAFYKGQDALVGLVFQVIETSGCHVFILAHQTIMDEKTKLKGGFEHEINPGFGTKSVVDKLAGRFTQIFYMRKNRVTNQFVMSAMEDKAYTISRGIDRDKCRKLKIELNTLPADLSHEIYDNIF